MTSVRQQQQDEKMDDAYGINMSGDQELQEETKQLEQNLNMLAINQPKSSKMNHGKVSG